MQNIHYANFEISRYLLCSSQFQLASLILKCCFVSEVLLILETHMLSCSYDRFLRKDQGINMLVVAPGTWWAPSTWRVFLTIHPTFYSLYCTSRTDRDYLYGDNVEP